MLAVMLFWNDVAWKKTHKSGLTSSTREPAIWFYLQKIIDRSDANKDGKLDMLELMDYLTEHEKNLHLQFRKLDTKNDGMRLKTFTAFRFPGMTSNSQARE